MNHLYIFKALNALRKVSIMVWSEPPLCQPPLSSLNMCACLRNGVINRPVHFRVITRYASTQCGAAMSAFRHAGVSARSSPQQLLSTH